MCWSGVEAQAFVLLRDTGFSFNLFPSPAPVFASFCSILPVLAFVNQAVLYLQPLSLNYSETSETQETSSFPLRDSWRHSNGEKCKGHSS